MHTLSTDMFPVQLPWMLSFGRPSWDHSKEREKKFKKSDVCWRPQVNSLHIHIYRHLASQTSELHTHSVQRGSDYPGQSPVMPDILWSCVGVRRWNCLHEQQRSLGRIIPKAGEETLPSDLMFPHEHTISTITWSWSHPRIKEHEAGAVYSALSYFGRKLDLD